MKTNLSSLQAEQYVLAAALSPDLIDDALSATTESLFAHEQNLTIFRAIKSLYAQGKPVDIVTMIEALRGSDAGQYVSDLFRIPATNYRAHIGLLRDYELKRRLYGAGQELIERVQTEDARVVRESVVSRLSDDDSKERGPMTFREIYVEHGGEIEKRADNLGKLNGLPTGFEVIDYRLNGLKPQDFIVIAARPSMGKAQPLTSGVLMADGSWKLMGEIQVGDRVASCDGLESIVTGVFPQGVRPIYRVTLNDGRSVEADAEHLWEIESCKWGESRVVTTLELADLLGRTRYQGRIRLAQHQGNFGHGTVDGVNPWLLGFLLGDGGLSQGDVRFSNPEPYIIDRVNDIVDGHVVSAAAVGCDYRISYIKGVTNPVKAALIRLGVDGKLAHEKFIPEHVFQCSKSVRQDVLAGLLESDGWVEKFNSVQFSSSSELLADGVIRLVQSLGGVATKRVKQEPKYTYRGQSKVGRDAYIVTVALSDIETFIRSPRLLKNLKPRSRSAAPSVKSVEYVRDDTAQCISVSHPRHLYITDGYVTTHNTTICVNIAEHNALKGEVVLIFSMEMSAASLMEKMISSVGGVPLKAIKNGSFLTDVEQTEGFKAAALRLRESGVVIDDRPGLSITEMRASAMKVKRKFGKLGLIVVDYIGLARGEGQNREQEVASVSRGLKGLAKELNIPVIGLSQLSRGVESRTDKRPIMSDLRESGAIEQDADLIAFLYRDEYYNESSRYKGITEVIWRKFRNGEVGTDHLGWQGDKSRFVNLARGWTAPDPEPENVKPIRRGMTL